MVAARQTEERIVPCRRKSFVSGVLWLHNLSLDAEVRKPASFYAKLPHLRVISEGNRSLLRTLLTKKGSNLSGSDFNTFLQTAGDPCPDAVNIARSTDARKTKKRTKRNTDAQEARCNDKIAAIKS
ncbi:uncharacterized protein LOC143143573 [Ptiloglossa arizonensis]|uniref:uncharacterized protein LOC143143573 n=1 Tax=Ptiloglossa arizonensis TaxID=3350558 RepID=UPI003F9F7EA1